MQKSQSSSKKNLKTVNLNAFATDAAEKMMTTDQGLRINDDHNSLKAGEWSATLEKKLKVVSRLHS